MHPIQGFCSCIYVLILIISILYHMYKVTYFIKIKSLIFGVILFGGARPIRLFADHIHRVDNAPKRLWRPLHRQQTGSVAERMGGSGARHRAAPRWPPPQVPGLRGTNGPEGIPCSQVCPSLANLFKRRNLKATKNVSMWIRRNMLRAPNINVICHKSRKPCPFGEG